VTHNPSQSAQSAINSVGQTVNSMATNPGGYVSGVASSFGQSASRTWNMINSGNDTQQEQGITNLLEFSGTLIAGSAAGADALITDSAGQGVEVTDIIKGFNHDGSYHGLDQIINRGVSPQNVEGCSYKPNSKDYSSRWASTLCFHASCCRGGSKRTSRHSISKC
jgi:hypothetical protein